MKLASQSAAAAYESAHAEAVELLDTLHSLLHDLPAPDDATLHWGHVGTVNEVNARLRELATLVESAV